MLFNVSRKSLVIVGLGLASVALSCTPRAFNAEQSRSGVSTTNIRHSRVKWQSIGNCWLYAVLGWGESLAMYNGKEKDFSESYLTYRFFEDELLNSRGDREIETGGSWKIAKDLILRHGLMLEGDFLPGESSATYSKTQKAALAAINESMKNGPLKSDRSPAVVRAELDKAWGVKIDSLNDKIIKAEAVQVATRRGTAPIKTLAAELNGWESFYWYIPEAWNASATSLPKGPFTLSDENRELLKRVKKALNARKPVVMSWYVDFNGMNDKGIFSIETLQKAGKPGRQGGHMTVIEDYVAHGVDPISNKPFQTVEGNVPAELKKLALEHGEIDYFVVKNSWGGEERLDRPSYVHDKKRGFTRLDASYIFGAMPTVNEESGEPDGGISTGLTEFILPKGY